MEHKESGRVFNTLDELKSEICQGIADFSQEYNENRQHDIFLEKINNANSFEELEIIRKEIEEYRIKTKKEVIITSQTNTSEIKNNNSKKDKEIKEIIDKIMNFSEINLSEFLDNTFENIKELSSEDKGLCIGGIFKLLEKRNIVLDNIRENGHVSLKLLNEDNETDELSDENISKYEGIINNALDNKKITLNDLNKGFLYKNNSFNDFIKNKDPNNLSLDDYVNFLGKKYGFELRKGENGIDLNNISPVGYNKFIEQINNRVSNNSEREFLISYVSDRFFREGNNLDISIKNYKDNIDTKTNEISQTLYNLTDEEKKALGIQKSSSENGILITNEFIGMALGITIILTLFLGIKKGLIGGLGLTAAAILYTNPEGGGQFLKDLFNKVSDLDSWKKPKTEGKTKAPELSESKKFYEKYIKLLQKNNIKNLDNEKLDNYAKELFDNKDFLNSKSVLLEIFEKESSFETKQKELKKIGIELTEENKEYYEYIFSEILKERKNELHKSPSEASTTKYYLGEKKESSTDNKPQTSATENKPQISATDNNNNNNQEISQPFGVQTVGYIDKGKFSITGEDGETIIKTYDVINPEYKKDLEKYGDGINTINNYHLILQSLKEKEKEKYDIYITNIENKLKEAKNINEIIEFITNEITDLNEKFGLNINFDLKDDEKVFDFIKVKNPGMVRNLLTEKIFKEKFSNITEEELEKFLQNYELSDSDIIKNILGEEEYIKLKNDLIKLEEEIINARIEIKEKVKKELKENNQEITEEELNKVVNEEIKKMKNGIKIIYVKDVLIKHYIKNSGNYSNMHGYGGDDENLKIYNTVKGTGWYNNVKDFIKKEVGPLGIGIIVGILTRRILGPAASSSSSKIATYGKAGVGTVVEGAGFYGGYIGTKSYLEEENLFNLRGLGETIGYISLFKVLGFLRKNTYGKINIPKSIHLPLTVAFDTAIIGGANFGGELLFGEGEWSINDAYNALGAAITFRVFNRGIDGKIAFTKSPTGRINVTHISPSVSKHINETIPKINGEVKDVLGIQVTKKSDGTFSTLVDGINKNFKNEKDLINYISSSSKSNVLLNEMVKSSRHDFTKKITKIEGKELKIEGNKYKFDSGILKKETSPGVYEDAVFTSIAENEAKLLIESIYGKGIIKRFNDLKNKINISDVISKTFDKSLKIPKKGFDHLFKQGGAERFNSFGTFKGLLGGLMGKTVTNNKLIYTGLAFNEAIDFTKDSDAYIKNFLSVNHVTDSLLNLLIYRYFGFIRATIFKVYLTTIPTDGEGNISQAANFIKQYAD